MSVKVVPTGVERSVGCMTPDHTFVTVFVLYGVTVTAFSTVKSKDSSRNKDSVNVMLARTLVKIFIECRPRTIGYFYIHFIMIITINVIFLKFIFLTIFNAEKLVIN